MFRNLLRLMPYVWQRRRALLAVLLMSLATSAIGLLQPWPIKILADYALGDEPLPQGLQAAFTFWGRSPLALIILAGLSSLLLFGIGAALDVGLSWAWMAAGQRMVYDFAADLYSRLHRLPLAYHNRTSVGDNLDRLSTDTWCVYSIVSDLLVTPAQCLCTILGVGFVAWLLDPWMTAICFAAVPLLAVSVSISGGRLKRRARQSREAHARLTSFVHQTVTSIPLVQAYSSEPQNQARLATLVDDAVAASQKRVLVDQLFSLFNGLANRGALAVVIFAGGQRVLAGSLSIGSLLVILAYVRTLQSAFRQLLQVYSKFKSSEASLERVAQVLDEPEEIREDPAAQPIPVLGSRSAGRIQFDNVTFGYQPDQPVLRNVTFCVEPGQRVGVVGATGAGKSTLAALIPRFFDPLSGTVSVNGLDVRLAQLDSLRAQVAIVTQDTCLLPITVAETIAYGCPLADRQTVIEAAKAAQAHEFIERLPAGYETIIGQRGACLSGGQRQRLAIARAFALDATIVILDEPTAALDAETEANLMEAIANLAARRTTLIIAHRLSTVRNADRILVIDEGRLAESGTHEELLLKRGTYANLCALPQTWPKECAK